MGLKILIKGEQEDDEKDKAFASANKYKTLFPQVLAITLGLGADDLGVFIPLFTTLTGIQIVLMLLVFVLGTAILCTVSYKLTQITALTEFIKKYERYIVGVVFTGLGILIMAECGTISKLISLF
jgi:cadmium resistance protein CadD (predicted permease)